MLKPESKQGDTQWLAYYTVQIECVDTSMNNASSFQLN